MNREDLEVKLELLNTSIEIIEEHKRFTKKADRTLMVVGIGTLIFVFITMSTKERLNVFDVFSMSLLVCSLHRMAFDMVVNSGSDNRKLKLLNIEKENIENRLKQMKEANELDLEKDEVEGNL